jgi:hypothetical protein
MIFKVMVDTSFSIATKDAVIAINGIGIAVIAIVVRGVTIIV